MKNLPLGKWLLTLVGLLTVGGAYLLRLAVVFGGLYWLTQAGALLFPGTALADPEFYPPPRQLYLDAGLTGLLGLGYAL